MVIQPCLESLSNQLVVHELYEVLPQHRLVADQEALSAHASERVRESGGSNQ
jgi:hypothetical protein